MVQTQGPRPSEAAGPQPELALSVAKFIELLHSVPTLDTNQAHRNLLLEDPGGFGEEQYNGAAHLIAIVKRCLGKNGPVDYLIDNAKLFAGTHTELAARLEAWREPLKQKTVRAPTVPNGGYDGQDVEKTSRGRTYLLLSWRTFWSGRAPNKSSPEPSPLRGLVPVGWSAEISYWQWGREKKAIYPAASTWSVPRRWLFTLRCVRKFFIDGEQEPEFEEELYLVPPLQRLIAVVFFLLLTAFSVALFLLLTKIDGLTELPWGSVAGFIAILATLPPLRWVHTRLQDWWVSARLGIVAGGTLAAVLLWLLISSRFIALRGGPDAIDCNGHPWEPKKWRVFPIASIPSATVNVSAMDLIRGSGFPAVLNEARQESAHQAPRNERSHDETIKMAVTKYQLPGWCKLAISDPKPDCLEFLKSAPGNDLDALTLSLFRLLTTMAPDESCVKPLEQDKHLLQSCSNAPIYVTTRKRNDKKGTSEELEAGKPRDIPVNTIVESYEALFGSQLPKMEFWTIGPPANEDTAAGMVTKNIAIRVGERLIGTYPTPTRKSFENWIPKSLPESCEQPRALHLTIEGHELDATGPLFDHERLHKVKLKLNEPDLRKIKLHSGSIEQVAVVRQNKSGAGNSTIHSAWIIDVLDTSTTTTCTINEDSKPVRICMKCPDKTGVHSAPKSDDDLCTLYREKRTPVYDENTGNTNEVTSCGP